MSPYSSHPALNAAYHKGAYAATQGLSSEYCPYTDKRTQRGCVTFSRAFMRAWMAGYQDARAHEPHSK